MTGVTGSRPIGGILSGSRMPTPWMTIHLCGLPGSVCGRDALSLHGLAPGGVYLATPVARGAGALLPHLFTLTSVVPLREPLRRFVFCGTFLRVASTGASQHPSLRSPDLPQHSELRRGHPAGSPSQTKCASTNAALPLIYEPSTASSCSHMKPM